MAPVPPLNVRADEAATERASTGTLLQKKGNDSLHAGAIGAAAKLCSPVS